MDREITVKAENYYLKHAASVLKRTRDVLLDECFILENNVKVVQNYFDGANYERLKINSTVAIKQIKYACEKLQRASDFLKKADKIIFDYLCHGRYGQI